MTQLSHSIKHLLAGGDHASGDSSLTIDFTQGSPVVDETESIYKIHFGKEHKVNRDDEIVFIVPHARNKRHQMIKSKDYGRFYTLNDMNRTINEALSTSAEPTEDIPCKLIIAYGHHLFNCQGISGTVYILWAHRICRINANSIANSLVTQQTPILFNLDGQMTCKAIFIFKPRITDTASELRLLPIITNARNQPKRKQCSPQVMWPTNPVFVCEKAPKSLIASQSFSTDVQSVTYDESWKLVSAPTKTAPLWAFPMPVTCNVDAWAALVVYTNDEDENTHEEEDPFKE